MANEDFPILIEVDPRPSVRAAETIGTSIERLDALASRVGQKIQNDITRGLERAAAASSRLQAGGPKQGGLFGGVALDKPLPLTNLQKGKQELEGLIQGFNNSAVAASRARVAYSSTIQTTGTAASATSFLKNQVVQLGIAYASLQGARALITGVVDLSDRFASLENRLRQTTSSTQELVFVEDQLFEAARRSRASVETLAETYGRVRLSLDKLGFTQNETIIFTETLSKAMSSSGKSTAETSAAMVQLSQALASGRLQGDEFRTITEAFPELLDIIAKQMGVTREEIKALSSEGKISAKVLADSLIGAADQIDEKFGRSAPTAAQAIQLLKNEVLRFVGEATRQLGPTLLQIAQGLGAAVDAARPLAAALNDLLSPARSLTGGSATDLTLVDFFKEVAQFVKDSTTELTKFAETTSGLLSLVGADSNQILRAMVTPEGITTMLQAVNATKSLTDSARELFEEKTRLLRLDKQAAESRKRDAEVTQSLAELEKRLAVDVTKAWLENINKIFDEVVEAHKKGESAAKKHASALQETLNTLFPVQAAYAEFARYVDNAVELVRQEKITYDEAKEALDRYRVAHLEQLDPLGAFHKAIEEQIEDLALTERQMRLQSEARRVEHDLITRGITLTDEEREAIVDAIGALDSATRAHEKRAEATKKAAEADKEFRQFMRDLPQEAAEVEEGLRDLALAFQEVAEQRDPGAGLRAGLRDIREKILDLGSLMRSSVVSAFNNAEDAAVDSIYAIGSAIGDVVKDGQADWKALGESLKATAFAFTESIIKDLTRILLRMALIKLLGATVGGPWGAASAGIPLFGFENGGDFVVPGTGGPDSQIVAFRATPKEQVSVRRPEQALSERRAGGFGAPMIEVGGPTIYNVTDPNGGLDAFDTPRGRRVFVNMYRQVADQLPRLSR